MKSSEILQLGTFINAFLGKPGAVAAFNIFTQYQASIRASRPLPLGGFLTAGIDATAGANSLSAFRQTTWHLHWCFETMRPQEQTWPSR